MTVTKAFILLSILHHVISGFQWVESIVKYFSVVQQDFWYNNNSRLNEANNQIWKHIKCYWAEWRAQVYILHILYIRTLVKFGSAFTSVSFDFQGKINRRKKKDNSLCPVTGIVRKIARKNQNREKAINLKSNLIHKISNNFQFYNTNIIFLFHCVYVCV